ncbi:hypothetical protein GCM10010495_33960 [Kitasatospora herbaricolor]|nr:hypothetical protein GCM10010495_33960 [Kitasatospora herbaricolor]
MLGPDRSRTAGPARATAAAARSPGGTRGDRSGRGAREGSGYAAPPTASAVRASPRSQAWAWSVS